MAKSLCSVDSSSQRLLAAAAPQPPVVMDNIQMDQLGNNLGNAGKAGLKKVVGFFEDFRNFINRGNVVDLAIGLVIGAAFTAIVTSVVNDLFGPVIGLIMGEVALENSFLVMRPAKNTTAAVKYPTIKAAAEAGAITLNWGRFLQVCINFFLVAFILFFLVKLVGWVRRKEDVKSTDWPCPMCLEAVKEGATRCPHCTSEIEAIVEGVNNHSAVDGDSKEDS